MRRMILFFLSAFFLLGNTFGYAVHASGMDMGTTQGKTAVSGNMAAGGCEGNQCCNSQTDCLYQHELKRDGALSTRLSSPSNLPVRSSVFCVSKRILSKKIATPPIRHVIPSEFLTKKQLK